MRFPATLLFLSLALAACTREREETLDVIVLDSDAGGAQAVRAATVEGLVGLDEQGQVIPALADRWTVTDDGQSYIFRLRDGTWRDGRPLTGETARAALRRALAKLRGTPLAVDFEAVEEVRAMAGRVVEIRLSRPVPEFLQLLAQPELGLVRGGEGTGPMALERQDGVAVLTPIPPEERGLAAVEGWAEQVRNVRVTSGTAQEAIERFQKEPATIVIGGTFNHWPAVADAGISRAAIRFDPVIGLFGLAPAHTDGFLADPENREAIAMAIDREALAAAIDAPGARARSRILPPGNEGDAGLLAERWANLTLERRQEIAAAQVARWRGGRGDVALRIALPSGPGADILFDRLSIDLTSVGLKVTRVAEGASADLRIVDTVARYSRADWFFTHLSCAARPKVCSPEADAAYAEAAALQEPAERARQLAEAEALLLAANTFIPLGAPLRWSLVPPDLTGFAVNQWGIHRLLPLAMRPAR